jgi:hypothetical protein
MTRIYWLQTGFTPPERSTDVGQAYSVFFLSLQLADIQYNKSHVGRLLAKFLDDTEKSFGKNLLSLS